jgi:chitin disaccharide deacetylase
MMSQLIMTSDDFAQSEAIDAGILHLIKLGHLTATSCLTQSPRWLQAAKLIDEAIRAKADIGLHLDFTQYNPILKSSLLWIMMQSCARVLPKKLIVNAIHQQLDAFENALGTAPDYIDGHQHVHQLPQIREALIEVLMQRYANQLPWIRISKPLITDGLKAHVIACLGANGLMKLARQHGIRNSQSLLGVYDFNLDQSQYQAKLTAWLSHAASGNAIPALMSHPAKSSIANQYGDPIYAARTVEYSVLADEAFKQSLKMLNIQLVRGNALTIG